MTTFMSPIPSTPSTTTSSTITSSTTTVSSTASPAALVRFVTTGLLATIESFHAGALPLHRFGWELESRIEDLAELGAPALVVTRLRWLQRTITHLHTDHATLGSQDLSGDERNCLAVTLASLRNVLATLTPPGPDSPSGAARPSTPAALRLVA